MMNIRNLFLFVVPAITAFYLGACTSGDSGSQPYGNWLLSGDYQINQIGDDNSGSSTVTARINVVSNGDGTGTYSLTPGNLSSYPPADISGTLAYSIAADRTMSVTAPNNVQGVIAASGGLFVLSDTSRTDNSGVVVSVGMKKTSGLTTAVFSGDYQVHQAGDNGTGLYTSVVNIHADPLNQANDTWSIVSHSSGATGSGSFTYAMQPANDGTFKTTTYAGLSEIGTDYGIASKDGSLFVISDTNPAASAGPPVEDAEIILAVGVKKSTNLSDAILKGNYQINQIGLSGGTRYTARVDFTADGNGHGTYALTGHSAGGTGSGTFDYTVHPDGTMDIYIPNNVSPVGTKHGIISADGSLIAISDTVNGTAPEDPEIVVGIGIRK